MHHLMFVTLTRPADATSEDTRQRVRTLLIDDDSFCGQGGRFGAPLADWFVIGGRWSGHLKETLLGKRYQTAFRRKFPSIVKHGLPSSAVEAEREKLNRFWHGFGGAGDHPALRSGYDELGSDDDAMLVDQALYTALLAQFKDESQSIGYDARPDFAGLDDDSVDDSFIGRKWLVVIDYHT